MNNKVKIPKKYKAELSERFDFRKARKGERQVIQEIKEIDTEVIREIKEIDTACPLCEDFTPNTSGCGGCPFGIFASESLELGCRVWLNKVIPHRSFTFAIGIWWDESEDKKVKEQLSLLRKKAKELIEWV